MGIPLGAAAAVVRPSRTLGGITAHVTGAEALVSMLQNPLVIINEPVTVRVEQVDLLSVAGGIDDPGLERLRCRLDELIDAGARLLVADLSEVDSCDGRLFELLARTQHRVGCHGGWLRLVGLSSSVLDALDKADLPDVYSCIGPRGGPAMVCAEHAPVVLIACRADDRGGLVALVRRCRLTR